MRTTGDASARETAELHYLLLRLAGKVPDGLVARARAWLAEDRVEEVARAVTFAAVAQRVPLLEDDVALLGQVLDDSGADPSMLAAIEIEQYDSARTFGFGASRPSADTAGRRQPWRWPPADRPA